uniref:Bifunctional phosphoglucose/phosphomannose isomerase n=1 Tax=candidate division WOR-3 bacterium TaxID=2052148 RepID=A0A7C6EDX4_UNCW3
MTNFDIFDLIYHLPEQIEDARGIAQKIIPPAKFIARLSSIQNIIISGMGGSGIGGEILAGLLSDYSPIPVFTIKDYSLPKYLTKRSLFFAVSHSGNTEETITAYQQAKSVKCPVICITSGGKLLAKAKNNNDLVVEVPASLPPRTAIGYLTIPYLVLLHKLGLVKNFNQAISDTIKTLTRRRDYYQAQAKLLAKGLVGKIPFVLSFSRLLNPVATRWRQEFNELAKVFAHTSFLPEHNHNEIEGLAGPSGISKLIYLLVLFDPNGHPRNKLRADLTLKITKGSFYRVRKFYPDGKSDLARIFSLIMQGDLLSYNLAIIRKVDPLPVKQIDKLKELMAKR